MVNSSYYQIYEFSQYDEEEGNRPYGTRLSGGMTWEDVPQVLKDAKKSLEAQLLNRDVRLDPCVFGQFLQEYNSKNQEVWYALVAVAHLDKDRFGRPLTALRYFWCECSPGDWKGLQAILKWFERLEQIPLWNRQDPLHQEPLAFYQVQKSSINPPKPYKLTADLLQPDYDQDLKPWKALQQLHSDVLRTVGARQKQDPKGSYRVAWVWNVSDLNYVNGLFIKPVDEVAYNRLKPRVPEIIWNAPDLLSTSNHSQLSPAEHPTTSIPVGSSSTMSLKEAIKAIAEQFPKDFNHQPNVETFRKFLEALEQGLFSAEREQLQKDFRDLGCTHSLWQDAQNRNITEQKLRLLFLWTLLLPTEILDKAKSDQNINHLIVVLTKSSNYQQYFKPFFLAICETVLELHNNVDHYKIQNLTPVATSILNLTCFFFGKLFVNDRKNHNSSETKKLQDLFKNLLQGSSWIYFLEIALYYVNQNLNAKETAPKAPLISQSQDWNDFETTLQRHIERYHKIWNWHQETYQKLIDQFPLHQQQYQNQCYQQWPAVYRRNRGSKFFWSPLFKDSGILTPLENYPKKVLKQEDQWWALRWQALFEHLDLGYSTVKDWPPDQSLPGGISFVPSPYTPGLRGKVEQGFQTVRKNVVTQWGNASKPPKPQPPIKPENDPQGSGNKQSNKSSGGEQDEPQPQHDKAVWIVGAVLVVVIALGIGLWRVIPWLRQIPPEKRQFAESVITRINNSLGFPGQTYISSEDLASSLAITLNSNQSLITDNNGLLAIGSKPRNLIRRLEDYQQRMGIVEQNNQFTETADSLLCLTIDRLILENSSSIVSPDPSKPITPGTLDEKIPGCNDERLFIDRQMYIANQRFWFGEILIWTQQEAEKASIADAHGELTEYLKSLNFYLDENIEFEPQDPAKKRQLLKAFYISAQENGALDISEDLIRPEKQNIRVGRLLITKGFFCGFSNVQDLKLSNCSAPAGDPTASTPVPAPVATTQPGDIYAGVPDDVKSFVDRYSDEWGQPKEGVLSSLKTTLGIPLGTDPRANVWQAKIKEFQKKYKLPEDGKLVAGQTTEANLATEIFGAQTPSQ